MNIISRLNFVFSLQLLGTRPALIFEEASPRETALFSLDLALFQAFSGSRAATAAAATSGARANKSLELVSV